MNDPQEILKHARAYVERMDFDKAVNAYTQLIKLDPHMTVAYEERAQAYDFLKKPDLAAADRKAAHKIENEDRLKHLKEERPDYRAEAIFTALVVLVAVLMYFAMT